MVYSGLCRLYRNLTPFNTDNLDVDLKYSVKDVGRARARCTDSGMESGLATRTLTLVLLAVEVPLVEVPVVEVLVVEVRVVEVLLVEVPVVEVPVVEMLAVEVPVVLEILPFIEMDAVTLF